jgi:hypothetical protein
MNNERLGNELIRQDGINPDKVSETERTAFRKMLHQQKNRMRHRMWVTSAFLLFVTLVLMSLWLLRLVPEHLIVVYLLVWAILAGIIYFCLVSRWLTRLGSKLRLKRILRRTSDTPIDGMVEHRKEPLYKAVFMSRLVQSTAAAVTTGLLLYSIFVSSYQPDAQGTIALGQTSLFSDSYAAIRVLVRDHARSRPIAGAQVRLAIEGRGISRELGDFVTGQDGSLSDAVHIPDVPPGKYDLIIDSRSKVGKDHIVKSVTIRRAYKVYITTDKPVYQPGQTIHMRALVLNEMSLEPFVNQPILFEIFDAKGNRVFKSNLSSSKYGIVSCDFELAREINLGRYRIRVSADDVLSEKTVTVKRYVLPKFKIELSTDKPFYLPSENINGTVKAEYFFGKPVANAQVEVIGRTVFESPVDVFKVTGTTDATGLFTFTTNLPVLLVGRYRESENTSLDIEVRVTDNAEHQEIKTEQCPVAQQSINIHAFPEGREFFSGVENIIYIMTAYPNGQPAVCELEVNGKVYNSDETGITVFRTNVNTTMLTLNIKARDKAGLTGTSDEQIWFLPVSGTLLLRTDKVVYKQGETLHATVLSGLGNSTIFMDVIKNGQTVLTKTLSPQDSRAELALDLSSDLIGTLKINAYGLTSRNEFVTDSRLVYVNRTKQLRIETTLDKAIYRPGETASLGLKVIDSDGKSAPAALSLAAVDEAVFYVCENRPGLTEQFFLTDKELLQPVYQMKFFVSPAKLFSGEEKYRNLARVLLSDEAQTMDWRELMWIPRNNDISRAPGLWHRRDYTFQAETHSGKLAKARAFHHRYVTIPLTVLLVLAILSIPLIVLGVLAHSIFSMLRILTQSFTTRQEQIQATSNKPIYLFAVLALFPLITYLTSLGVQGLKGTRYRIYFDDIFLFVGILVVGLLAIAITIFPKVLHFDSISRSIKLRTKGLIFSLIFGALVLIVLFYVVKATMSEVGEFPTSLVVASSFLLTLVLSLAAGATSEKIQSRLYESIGKIGRFVVIFVLAETLVLHMLILPAPLRPVMRSFNETFQNPSPRLFAYSRYMGGYGGGMGGYGGGMGGFVAGYGGGMGGISSHSGAIEPPRIREYFPETLLWQPEVITDVLGRAAIEIPLADSITSWKMNVDGVSDTGRLGSSEVDIRVFQDFFIDVDLPVSLTRGDEMSVPILCYNYLQKPQSIELTLPQASWCEVSGPATQTIELDPNNVRSISFRIKALQVGTHKLEVRAQGTSMSDAVQRSVKVLPDGVEVQDLQVGVLSRSAEHTFTVPTESIPGSQKLLLKLYPSRFSEVVEGLESIFRMPYGCFEQTSSITYPNVMALLYMKSTGQVTPEIELKAKRFIATGYQRLLSFEVDDGGFDWFGQPLAKEKLTAYGILEFTDMSKVHPVDQAVIERAGRWLLSRQHTDGSWNSSSNVETLNNGEKRTADTAYIIWALTEAGIRGRKLESTFTFLRQNLNETEKPYTLALAANAFLANDPNDTFGMQLVSWLSSQFQIEGGSAYIRSSGAGAMYSRGLCLDIETTALSSLAMIKANPYADTARKALTWLCEQKDQYGTWRSTQATILAMKALIAGTSKSKSGEVPINVQVFINEQAAGSIEVAAEKQDLLHTLDLTAYLRPGKNDIHLIKEQDVELPYRLVGNYWVPQVTIESPAQKELEIRVDYDRKRLAVDDTLRCSVQVTRRSDSPMSMAIIDLGIPPGFRVEPSAFDQLVPSGVLAKYELTTNQCILYVRSIIREQPLRFTYELKALYPIRAQIPPSSVYEYYNPENRDQSISGQIVVE